VLRSFAGGLMGERFGSGPPKVLALHGWGRSHLDFSAVLAPPGSKPLDAIALDLPGFGATPPPPEPWGSTDYAERVAEVLVDMDEPVVVLGHSFGGRVAVQLAAARPEAVGALVLSGVPLVRRPGPRPRALLSFRLARVLHRMGALSEDRMEGLRHRHGSADYRAAQGVMRPVLVRVVNEHYEEALAAIRCPVTFVWGDDDEVAPVAMARVAARQMSDAQLIELPGAGHLTPLTSPQSLYRAVTSALLLPGVSG